MTDPRLHSSRSVRRARARMARPSGRKAAKAAVRVARHDAQFLIEEAALQARTERARQAQAGVMPHAPRPKPRERLKPHLGRRR